MLHDRTGLLVVSALLEGCLLLHTKFVLRNSKLMGPKALPNHAICFMHSNGGGMVGTENNIKDGGATACGMFLSKNSTLRELHLGGNEIGDDGVVHIANGVRDNSSLNKLSLEWNQFGDTGVLALAEALKTNTSVSLLSVYGTSNKVGQEGKAALEALRESNGTRKIL
ncbi:hypothetical protein CYMTET_50738 [Cymbomonas tetramitiformis]|uniref:Uncharacterized protein n=1 Tax=Cymbomonas tetramitiformis TaxID=36881 RepID=A0AAE0ESV0_9CHLO|nr:hypothetical protein CYMTET_50738 [Cymbomonas tetramitiformis]